EAGGLGRNSQLGVLAGSELGERVELQDGNERWIGGGILDRLVSGIDRLGPALCLEDGRLPEAFGAQDGRLLVAFGGLDLRLLLTVRDVDLRLLPTFRFEDEGALLLVGGLLESQGIEDHL